MSTTVKLPGGRPVRGVSVSMQGDGPADKASDEKRLASLRKAAVKRLDIKFEREKSGEKYQSVYTIYARGERCGEITADYAEISKALHGESKSAVMAWNAEVWDADFTTTFKHSEEAVGVKRGTTVRNYSQPSTPAEVRAALERAKHAVIDHIAEADDCSPPADPTNPRVLAWLRAVGLTQNDIRHRDGEVARVSVAGERNIWTVLYSEWIRSQWRIWAASLGFEDRDGFDAQDCAALNGHTADEFDAWLRWSTSTSDKFDALLRLSAT